MIASCLESILEIVKISEGYNFLSKDVGNHFSWLKEFHNERDHFLYSVLKKVIVFYTLRLDSIHCYNF